MDKNGRTIFRLGVETGITRREPLLTVYDRETWELSWHGPRVALNNENQLRARRSSIKTGSDRRIAGLLHITQLDSPCIAVVIPPAFGKKERGLGPLALTLVAHFVSAGENVAVLRYDGTDRPGESDKRQHPRTTRI